MICQCLEDYATRKGYATPFSIVAKILKEKSKNVDLKTTLMTFINAIINSYHVLEDRVFHRTQLLDDEITDTIASLREWCMNHKIEESFQNLETQFDVFEKEADLDKREIVYKDLDLSDPETLWKFLQDSSKQDGTTAQLADALRHFIIVPSTGEFSKKIWDNVVYAIRIGTSEVRNKIEVDKLRPGLIDDFKEEKKKK
eukprot:TRINITY_DN4641_c0_g1_i1.p1 TRINITY_DN4641_c0_g1~~TRINITY_DN4641_c0_g1_i1.p1  ORF type:complete len:199 (-),score=38.66 TRINITY_DN4641_c0_g1_i1:60-656(-)